MSLKEKDKEYDQYVTDQKLSSEDQVKGFKFSGWKSLSDNYLIITAVHKKDYLIETKGRCIELNNSHAIQINQYSSLSISKYGDSISPSRKAIDKCFIKTIYPITDIQTDYLVNIGKSEKNGV
jgi:hypothetical protein